GRADPSRLDIQLVSGGTAQDVTNLIHGGELGGLLNYRGDVLDLAFNALGRMSLSIASEFNQQLGKGLDLNGQVGTDLFGDINGPEYLELRSRGREGNLSEATLDVRIADTSALTTSDYELTFTTDTEFTVRRAGDGRVLGPFDLTAEQGQPGYAVFDGLDLSRGGEGKGFNAGPYREGDRYLLTPTRSAAKDLTVDMTDPRELAFAAGGDISTGIGDNRNALALSELQNRPVLGKGENARGFSLLDGYGDLVQKVATFTAQSRTEA